MAVVNSNKLVLSRSYGGASQTGATYSIARDACGQLHDALVSLVAGGSAAGAMADRLLPMAIETAGTISLKHGSRTVTGTGIQWNSELAGFALQIVRDNTGFLVELTFPVKCFGQAPSPHKGRVILTNHARELGFQWESSDDVRDSPPDKQQLLLPNPQ